MPLIECGCGARYRVGGGARARRARCRHCGASFVVPAAAELPEAGPAREDGPVGRRGRRSPSRPGPTTACTALGITALAWGLARVPYLLFGILVLAAAWDIVPSPEPLLLLACLTALSQLAGGIGLLLARAWGWWLTLGGSLLGAFVGLRTGWTPLSALDHEHPEARRVLLALVLVFGLPALIDLALLALIAPASVRRRCRVTSAPLPRRRAARP